MSGFKGHLTGGYIAGILTLIGISLYQHSFPSLYTIIISLLIIGLYSILPDVDTRASQARMILTIVCAIAILLGLTLLHNIPLSIFSIIVLLFMWVSEFIPGFQHRGIIHSWIMPIIFSLPLYFYFGFEVALVGAISYISHLILDMKKH